MATRDSQLPLKSLVTEALQGRATAHDWRKLSYINWELIPGDKLSRAEVKQILENLALSSHFPEGEAEFCITSEYLIAKLSDADATSLTLFNHLAAWLFKSDWTIIWG